MTNSAKLFASSIPDGLPWFWLKPAQRRAFENVHRFGNSCCFHVEQEEEENYALEKYQTQKTTKINFIWVIPLVIVFGMILDSIQTGRSIQKKK